MFHANFSESKIHRRLTRSAIIGTLILCILPIGGYLTYCEILAGRIVECVRVGGKFGWSATNVWITTSEEADRFGASRYVMERVARRLPPDQQIRFPVLAEYVYYSGFITPTMDQFMVRISNSKDGPHAKSIDDARFLHESYGKAD